MKSYSVKPMRIDKLLLPGDIKKRMKHLWVIELATSEKRIGLLHAPTVRRKDKKLLAGKDRVAACMINKREMVDCKMVDCSDHEAKEIEYAENCLRRHDPEEDRLKLLAKLEKYTKEEEAAPTPHNGKKGAPKKPKTRARERVAKERGVSTAAIRKAEHTQKTKEKTREAKPVPTIITFGVELTEEFIAEMEIIRRYVEDVQVRLRGVQAKLTQLENSETSVPANHLQRIKEALQHEYQELNVLKPHAVCPYCKGISPYQETCGGCVQAGWVSKVAFDQVDPVLQNEEDVWLSINGQLTSLADAMGEDDKEPTVEEMQDAFDFSNEDPVDPLEYEETEMEEEEEESVF